MPLNFIRSEFPCIFTLWYAQYIYHFLTITKSGFVSKIYSFSKILTNNAIIIDFASYLHLRISYTHNIFQFLYTEPLKLLAFVFIEKNIAYLLYSDFMKTSLCTLMEKFFTPSARNIPLSYQTKKLFIPYT